MASSEFHHAAELVGLLAQATAEVFAGDERLEALHDAWVEVIGAHVSGGG